MFREKRSLSLRETPGAEGEQQKQLVIESITTTLKFLGTRSTVMIGSNLCKFKFQSLLKHYKLTSPMKSQPPMFSKARTRHEREYIYSHSLFLQTVVGKQIDV